MARSIQQSNFLKAIQQHDPSTTAVVNYESGRVFSYETLLRDVLCARQRILNNTQSNISGERIAFLVENGYSYVVTLLSVLACDAIAVPLAPSFTAVELNYIINDSGAFLLLSSPGYGKKARELLKEGKGNAPYLHLLDDLEEDSDKTLEVDLANTASSASGMMLYTSGTTARPKGVLLSESALSAQAKSLLEAWDFTPSDHLLHVLPLHHIHGTVNAILTPLLAGGSIEFMYPFDIDIVWKRLASPFLGSHGVDSRTPLNGDSAVHDKMTPITIFTAVPTIWARMLQSFSSQAPEIQEAGKQAISRDHLRLNMSGSAALPKPTRDGWNKLSGGNVLLERYGMTEVGMALSCGLDDADRIESSVGWPLPSVEVRLMEMNDDTGAEMVIEPGGEIDPVSGKERQGEIQLRGPTVFKEYWLNPTATKKEFTQDGWFKTGDIAIRRTVPGSGRGTSGQWARGPAYMIQGRQSADILKTGGEKVSALEIERELMSLPQVQECAVVGLPSESWGQKVAAVVVLSRECGESSFTLADMRREMKTRLVAYKIPQDMEAVADLKRNAMGKVNKKELVSAIFGDQEKIRRRSIDRSALKTSR